MNKLLQVLLLLSIPTGCAAAIYFSWALYEVIRLRNIAEYFLLHAVTIAMVVVMSVLWALSGVWYFRELQMNRRKEKARFFRAMRKSGQTGKPEKVILQGKECFVGYLPPKGQR